MRRHRRNATAGLLFAVAATIWSIAPAAPARALAPSTLWRGSTLGVNQVLQSADGRFRAVMQGDGNLVVYGPHGPTWASNTLGSGTANRLVMQSDGNLVMYASTGGVPFATATFGTAADALVMQNDGNLVLYGGGAAFWASEGREERAIEWFYGRLGSTAYEGRCELAVENAFGTSGRYPTARSNWNARNPKMTPHSSARRGHLVFWNTSSAGHVAISLGNGRVVTSSAPGRRIGIADINYFQNPLGWAYNPF
jgi:cell wall-associated NlpC family hydrolase